MAYETGSLEGDLAKAKALTTQQYGNQSGGQPAPTTTTQPPVPPPSTPFGVPSPQTGATVPVSVNPSTQVPSSSLANPTTQMDWMALLQQNLARQDSLITGVTGALTPTQQELDDQKRLNDAINAQQNFDVSYEGGLQKIAKQPIALEFQQGQQSALTRDAAFTRSSLARQVDAYTRVLQSSQANRQQKLEAARFLYDSNRNSLSDTITLMKATAPENIGNVVDPQTGEMTVIMKNPITGEVTRNNLGVVQTPQKQIDNIKFAQESGVNMPFYTKTNGTNQVVINATNGREYSTIEQAAADGVDTKNWSNVQHNVQSFQMQQFNYNKSQDAIRNNINLSQEARAQAQFNIDNGITGPTGSSIAAVYPDGSTGPGSGNLTGQCAVFTGAITDLGTPGNKLGMDLKAKQQTVNDYGVSADQWRSEGPNVGDAIIFNIGENGHTATVNSVNPDGTVTLSESNYKNDRKVSNTRTIPITDKSIYGVIRGTLKSNVISNTNSNTNPKVNVYAQDVIDGKITLTSVPDKLQTQVSQKVQELRSQSKYGDEWEARVDYDNELRQLREAFNSKTLASNPSDIIAAAVATYGKYISKQEIEATIQRIFGASRPSTQTQSTTTPTTNSYSPPGFFSNITNNLSEFYNVLMGRGY